MIQEIYILDLIGTFAFSIYGSYFALNRNFNIFWIFISAFLTAMGGWTIRELFLNNIPFYFFDTNYIIAIISGIFITIFIYKNFYKIEPFVLFFDSIGLVTFSFIGASKADSLGLGLFAIIFFATLTAVGGGIIRDILLNQISKILYYDSYASIAILLGICYRFFEEKMEHIFWVNLLIITCLVIRLFIVYYKVNLWLPINYQQKLDLDNE